MARRSQVRLLDRIAEPVDGNVAAGTQQSLGRQPPTIEFSGSRRAANVRNRAYAIKSQLRLGRFPSFRSRVHAFTYRRRRRTYPAALLLSIDNPARLDELREHFTRSSFTVELLGGSMVEVRRPDASDAEQERREVGLHLRLWLAMNPDAAAEVVE